MKAILSFLFPSWTYKDAAIELESLGRREISLDQVLTMEKQIASFRTEQVDVLAKKIIAAFANQFNIDIRFGIVEERPTVEYGHPIYHVLPTVNSRAEKGAVFLPQVQIQIEEAIAAPQSYTYNGDTFSTSTEEDQQMVNEWLQAPRQETQRRIGDALSNVLFPSVKQRIEEAIATPFGFIAGEVYFPLFTQDRRGLFDQIDRSLHVAELSDLAGLALSVNLESPDPIRFEIKKYIHSHTTLIDAGTLDEFTLDVELGVV